MLTSPSHNAAVAQRVFRAAILNSVPVPPAVVAQLEARGINVGELEARIRQNMEFVR